MRNRITLALLTIIVFLVITESFREQDSPAPAQSGAPIIGRWDLTVDMGYKVAPSWLEVKLSGIKTLVGYFVADGGSARPISKVNWKDGKVSFSIPPQWDATDRDMVFEGELKDGRLTGTIFSSKGEKHTFTGERAPLLKREKAPQWGEPVALFNGKDTKGWHADRPGNQWVAENGVLKSPKSGANIIT
ncbi:MAG: DUF1080 domain-containing protein, partial [Chitinophagia bacterium]|nr:DUF1080 domain-containing protein [Chitinophagia bacterium]